MVMNPADASTCTVCPSVSAVISIVLTSIANSGTVLRLFDSASSLDIWSGEGGVIRTLLPLGVARG